MHKVCYLGELLAQISDGFLQQKHRAPRRNPGQPEFGPALTRRLITLRLHVASS